MSRLPRIDKVLLNNVIKHADGHNKYVETQEMWRQRQKELKSREAAEASRREPRERMYSGSRSPNDAREEEKEYASLVREIMNEPRLVKTERWGHDGYSSLYGGKAPAPDLNGPPAPELRRSKLPGPTLTPSGRGGIDAESKKRKRDKEKKPKKKSKKDKKDRKDRQGGRPASVSDSDSDGDGGDRVRRKRHKKSKKSRKDKR